jgi:hypothetical protein
MYSVSFQEIDRSELGLDHLPPHRFEVKEGVKLYLYFPSVPACNVRDRIVFY